MRKISGLILIFMMLTGMAYAKGKGVENSKKKNQYAAPVVVNAVGFSAVYNNGVVETRWKKYLRDDLKYYKLVRSENNPDPVYPEDGYIFYATDPGQTTFTDSSVTPGTWYYRLCIITRQGDRWVSPVVTVEVEETRRSAPTSKDFQ